MNLYGFANGDPINFSDPFGLCPTCGAAAAALSAALTPVSGRAEGRNVVISTVSGIEQVRSGGTRAWRNNNPGNLRNSSFAQRQGSIGEAGGFAVFGSEGVGGQALGGLLQTGTYQSLTLDGAIARYAPASENDTRAYQQLVQNATGLSGDTPMSRLSPEQLQGVAGAIRRMEGWREGSATLRPPRNDQ